MAKTLINCKNCGKEFYAENRELNRDQGYFCCQTCASIYNNANRVHHSLTCEYCGESYVSVYSTSKYCSKLCSQRAYRLRTGYKSTRSTISNRVNKHLPSGTSTCLHCGWNQAVCDIHHILPRSEGGTDKFDNLSVLCPNCHRLAHNGLITPPAISSKVPTISSPS